MMCVQLQRVRGHTEACVKLLYFTFILAENAHGMLRHAPRNHEVSISAQSGGVLRTPHNVLSSTRAVINIHHDAKQNRR